MGIRLGSSTPFGQNTVVPQRTVTQSGGVVNSPNAARADGGQMFQAAGQITPDTIAENFSGPVTRHTGLPYNPVSPGQQTQGYGQQAGLAGRTGAGIYSGQQNAWSPMQASGLMNAKVLRPGLGNQQTPQMYAGPQAQPTMMTSQAPQWNPLVASNVRGQAPTLPQGGLVRSGYHPSALQGWQPGDPGLYQRFGNQPSGGGYRDLDGFGGQSRTLTGWWPGGYMPQGGWGGY